MIISFSVNSRDSDLLKSEQIVIFSDHNFIALYIKTENLYSTHIIQWKVMTFVARSPMDWW